MSISLCLMVRNEEDKLAACLQSAADLVDETIVVDTGSTDGTRELAAKLGARVFEESWCDDFAAARNECIRQATQNSRSQTPASAGGCLRRREKTFRKDMYSNKLRSANVSSRIKRLRRSPEPWGSATGTSGTAAE